MPSILFVCTANRFRSPLAAVYFARKVVTEGDDKAFRVSSAGTWAISGQPVMDEALDIAKENNLNLNLHRSRMITGEILASSDLILVMETGHKEAISQEFKESAERVFLLTEAIGDPPLDILDPFSSSAKPEPVAREILEIIDRGYGAIIKLARENYLART